MLVHFRTHKEAFTPEEVAILVGAFDEACRSTLVQPDGKAEATREILAKRIIESAKLGVLNQQRLCKDALDHLAMIVLSASQDHRPSGAEG
jgi:hypothetical protein